MKYPNGQEAHLNDVVKLWAGAEGIVVCSLDTNEFSSAFPKSEWGYLKKGILIESPQAGLIHYIEPEATLELVRRGTKA
ncbi:hypothetical protein FRZ61_27690 [Hypericibacter adhaerens]|jgi:hypothetical protein|uniref:Uncharacterized protein n=1 Tax=Hypericibacter adhaerens TaxID=2602016 RepID=A0A5J6N743_9PROT|nr:hypothetical protein [Hypericibacter adhaerens]QEX22836.1 hypothetical protein FRZ61_27690 [Hypericibacter adhaerens]